MVVFIVLKQGEGIDIQWEGWTLCGINEKQDVVVFQWPENQVLLTIDRTAGICAAKV